jgi:hypothetical protein
VAKKSIAAQSHSALAKAAESALQGQRAVAERTLRTVFLNLFRHNSTKVNSAKFESRWRFTINVCWRDGEPVPCPAAIGHQQSGRAGHNAEIEFSVSVVESELVTRMRVDDAVLVEDFPSVRLVRGYPKELGVLLQKRFGLAYPTVEDQPVG